MLKRIALMVALVTVMGVEAEAARRGGCANGQCGMRTYYPAPKVAVQSADVTWVSATATVTAPAAEAAPSTQQTQYVASQGGRRTFFRRWSR